MGEKLSAFNVADSYCVFSGHQLAQPENRPTFWKAFQQGCPNNEQTQTLDIQFDMPVPPGINASLNNMNKIYGDLRQSFLHAYQKEEYFQVSVQDLETTRWKIRGRAKLNNCVHLRNARKRIRSLLVRWHDSLCLGEVENAVFGQVIAAKLIVKPDVEPFTGPTHWWTPEVPLPPAAAAAATTSGPPDRESWQSSTRHSWQSSTSRPQNPLFGCMPYVAVAPAGGPGSGPVRGVPAMMPAVMPAVASTGAASLAGGLPAGVAEAMAAEGRRTVDAAGPPAAPTWAFNRPHSCAVGCRCPAVSSSAASPEYSAPPPAYPGVAGGFPVRGVRDVAGGGLPGGGLRDSGRGGGGGTTPAAPPARDRSPNRETLGEPPLSRILDYEPAGAGAPDSERADPPSTPPRPPTADR